MGKSKKLYEYLKESGVLNANEEEIKLAKIAYRKQYLKNWKAEKAPTIKEIRIVLELKEYNDIKIKAYDQYKTPTTYAKDLLLESMGKEKGIPDKDKLHAIYQKIGLAINQNLKDHSNINLVEKLVAIEEELSEYLKNK